MSSFISGLAEVAPPTLCVFLYLVVVGLGVRATIWPWVRLPAGAGLTAGMGLSLIALLMVYSYRVTGLAVFPIIPVAVLSIIVLARRQYLDRSFLRYPSADDLAAAIISLVVAFPTLKFGMTFWTSQVNDFPSYAASAEIWATSREVFAAKHPDPFGQLQLLRSTYEKPMVTAFLVLIHKLTTYETYRLLSPAMIVPFFIGVSSAVTVVRNVFKIGSVPASLVVALPTFSIIPISRYYDAQPGHVVAISLLFSLLAILATAELRAMKAGRLALALTAGIMATATIGANFTLMAGSSILLGATIIWVFSRTETLIDRLKIGVGSAIVAIVLSLPMVPFYLISLSHQTAGDQGYLIPFASPLAAIGQQITLYGIAPQTQTLFAWILVIFLYLVTVWARHEKHSPFWEAFVLIAAVGNALIISLKLGWDNYSTHKWLAVAIAFSCPLLIASAISNLVGRQRVAAIAAMFPLAFTSAAFSIRLGSEIAYVVPNDLIELRYSEVLAKQGALNIRLGDMRLNSAAALIAPSEVVNITEQTYAAASLPLAGMTLVRNDGSRKAGGQIDLNTSFSLIPTLSLPEGDTAKFDNSSPEAKTMLSGNWYAPEAWGTWSSGGDNFVILEIPERLRDSELTITITGSAYTREGSAQKVDILINDSLLVTREYPNDDRFTLNVPNSLFATNGNIVRLNFRVPAPISPSDHGSADVRSLGFGLREISLAKAN